jgi:transposase-like protein
VCDLRLINTPALTDHYEQHHFPVEIISHGVWLYYRFCLSYRDVEELLSARGIIVMYETIRQWFLSACGPIVQHFRPRRHLLSALEYRQEMAQRFQRWHEVTGTVAA